MAFSAAGFAKEERTAARKAEELVARLEHGEPVVTSGAIEEIRDAVFSDSQRVRVTAVLLRETPEGHYHLVRALLYSKTFSKALPREAISKLIEFVGRWAGQDHGQAQAVAILVVAMQEGRFDDVAFARVSKWLPNGSDGQRTAAIQILGAIPSDDARLARAVDSLASVLEVETVTPFLENTARGLARLAPFAVLDERTHDRLLNLATTHEDQPVRLGAAEALVAAGAGTRTEALSATLAEQISTPNRLSHFNVTWPDTRTNYQRGVDALAALVTRQQPPYSATVIDALIAATPESLEALGKIRAAGQLSAPQVAALERRAADSMTEPVNFAEAYQIYDMLQPGAGPDDPGTLVAALSGTDTAARYAAAFRLRAAALRGSFTPEIASAARRVVLDDRAPPGLRALAADILVARGIQPEDPVPTLVMAVEDAADPSTTLNFLGPAILRSLEPRPDGRDVLLGYASQVERRGELRAWLLDKGLRSHSQDEYLPEDVRRRLDALAAHDPDRGVRWAAASVLQGYGVVPPLASRLESGQAQSAAMWNAFVALLIAFPIFLIAGCMRFRRWWLAGWLLFSLWIAACFLLGFLGMLGHNSPPPWRATFQANVPLYVSFAVYACWLIGASICARRRMRAGGA